MGAITAGVACALAARIQSRHSLAHARLLVPRYPARLPSPRSAFGCRDSAFGVRVRGWGVGVRGSGFGCRVWGWEFRLTQTDTRASVRGKGVVRRDETLEAPEVCEGRGVRGEG